MQLMCVLHNKRLKNFYCILPLGWLTFYRFRLSLIVFGSFVQNRVFCNKNWR